MWQYCLGWQDINCLKALLQTHIASEPAWHRLNRAAYIEVYIKNINKLYK
jgi:hypothetical protein